MIREYILVTMLISTLGKIIFGYFLSFQIFVFSTDAVLARELESRDDAEDNVSNVNSEEANGTREARTLPEKAAAKVDLFKITSY